MRWGGCIIQHRRTLCTRPAQHQLHTTRPHRAPPAPAVSCNGDLGIAGLKWRRAKIKNPDGAEARLGGLTVLCNRAGNAPEELVLDPAGTAQTHDRLFSCKKVAKYAGMDMPKITKALLWYNLKSWASLEPIECG